MLMPVPVLVLVLLVAVAIVEVAAVVEVAVVAVAAGVRVTVAVVVVVGRIPVGSAVAREAMTAKRVSFLRRSILYGQKEGFGDSRIDEGMKWSEVDIGWKDWWVLSGLQTPKLDITKGLYRGTASKGVILIVRECREGKE